MTTRANIRNTLKAELENLLPGVPIFNGRKGEVDATDIAYVNVFFHDADTEQFAYAGADTFKEIDSADLIIRFASKARVNVDDILDDMAEPIQSFIKTNNTLHDSVERMTRKGWRYGDFSNTSFSYYEITYTLDFLA